MKFTTAAALVAVSVVGGLGAAQASPTHTYTIDLAIPTDTTDNIDGMTYDFSKFGSLHIPGGSLTGVAFDLSGTSQTSGSIKNTTNSSKTYTVKNDVTLTLTRPNGGTLVVAEPTSTVQVTAGKKATKTFTGPVNTNSTSSGTLTDAADLALFGGIGQISLPVNVDDNTGVSGNANRVDNLTTTASSTLHVTYYYIVTPEPAEIAPFILGGLGLLGLALRARKARVA